MKRFIAVRLALFAIIYCAFISAEAAVDTRYIRVDNAVGKFTNVTVKTTYGGDITSVSSTIDLGERRLVNELQITFNESSNFTISISDDGQEWRLIATHLSSADNMPTLVRFDGVAVNIRWNANPNPVDYYQIWYWSEVTPTAKKLATVSGLEKVWYGFTGIEDDTFFVDLTAMKGEEESDHSDSVNAAIYSPKIATKGKAVLSQDNKQLTITWSAPQVYNNDDVIKVDESITYRIFRRKTSNSQWEHVGVSGSAQWVGSNFVNSGESNEVSITSAVAGLEGSLSVPFTVSAPSLKPASPTGLILKRIF